jgi:sodium-dependent dicarboxylate transporter 2/3/5
VAIHERHGTRWGAAPAVDSLGGVSGRDDSPRRLRRAIALAAAAAVAILAVLIAPEPWEEEPASLRVLAEDSVVLDVDVELGSTAAWMVSEGGVVVEAPEGFPVDAPIALQVSGVAVSPVVELHFGDGTVELLPVLGGSEATDWRVVRRPPRNAAAVLGLLGGVIVLWVTEVWPLHVTSLLIPVVLVGAGVGSAREVLAPFFDPIIVLFFAGFLMAEAMRRVGLDHLAAISLVGWAGRGPVRLFAALLAVSAFLSMWMSNTAAVTVLLPIVIAVTDPIGHLGYRKAAILGVAYAATIGGVGSLVGTPANPLAVTFIEELTGRAISFVEWFAFGLPMVVLLLPIMGVWLWWTSRVEVDADRFVEARRVAEVERERAGRPSVDQLVVLGVFGAVMVGWLTETWHDISTGIVALAGAVVLMVIGKVRPEDLGRISWPTLLTFGGGLSLGLAMVSSGVSDHLVSHLEGLADLPSALAIGAVATVALLVTTAASNTASAATLIPLSVPLAGLIGVDPVLLVLVVAIASSIDFALVIGTPPTMLAYGNGHFTAAEVVRKGSVLDIVGILLLVTIVTAGWNLFGLL